MATMATQSKTDFRLGFDSLEHEVSLDSLPVSGTLPDWLTGSLIRTGPAKYEVGDRVVNHWFDGLAMLHRFSFGDGEVSYANRFLHSKAFDAAKRKGEISYSEFATDPCRSLFKRMTTMFRPQISDNANVNVVRLAEDFIALTETPLPVAFDGRTLETLGVAYKQPGQHATAHPHWDPATEELLSYAVKFGPRSKYRIYAQRDRSTRRTIAEMSVSEPAYMHSFAMTERYIVLTEQPLVVKPTDLLLSGRPFIENYRWEAERGTTFIVVDRHSGELVGRYATEAFFTFHHVNAYEEDGEIVLDASASDDAGVIQDFYLDKLRSGQRPTSIPQLRRYRIPVGGGKVTGETLIDDVFELPTINYGRVNTQHYRYAYGGGAEGPAVSPEPARWLDRIVKADVEDRKRWVWHEEGSYPGEPVFVAAPDGEDEDDGVLLSVVLSTERQTSYLLVLDAHDLSELARAEVPHHIPFGFHGQYFDDVG
jgi:beta,beta-carotene 9',10'-dioxygenase